MFDKVLGSDRTLCIYSELFSVGRVLLEILLFGSGQRLPFTWAYDRDQTKLDAEMLFD